MPDRVKNSRLVFEGGCFWVLSRFARAIAPAKTNTTTERIRVPKSDGIPLSPIFTNSETSPANTADSTAYTNHPFETFVLASVLPSIIIVPPSINDIDKNSMQIVRGSPPFVVSSKKKIKNRMLDKTKLDLSIGATLLTSASFSAR